MQNYWKFFDKKFSLVSIKDRSINIQQDIFGALFFLTIDRQFYDKKLFYWCLFIFVKL